MAAGGSKVVGPWSRARFLTIRIPIGVDSIGEGEIARDIPGLIPPSAEEYGTWELTIDLFAGRFLEWAHPGRGFSVRLRPKDSGTYILLDAKKNPIVQLAECYVPHGILDGDFGDSLELDILDDGRIECWPDILDTSDFEDGSTDFTERPDPQPVVLDPWVNPYELELKRGDVTPERRRELLKLARRYRLANPQHFTHRSP